MKAYQTNIGLKNLKGKGKQNKNCFGDRRFTDIDLSGSGQQEPRRDLVPMHHQIMEWNICTKNSE